MTDLRSIPLALLARAAALPENRGSAQKALRAALDRQGHMSTPPASEVAQSVTIAAERGTDA